jgi:hypothetical protein
MVAPAPAPAGPPPIRDTRSESERSESVSFTICSTSGAAKATDAAELAAESVAVAEVADELAAESAAVAEVTDELAAESGAAAAAEAVLSVAIVDVAADDAVSSAAAALGVSGASCVPASESASNAAAHFFAEIAIVTYLRFYCQAYASSQRARLSTSDDARFAHRRFGRINPAPPGRAAALWHCLRGGLAVSKNGHFASTQNFARFLRLLAKFSSLIVSYAYSKRQIC